MLATPKEDQSLPCGCRYINTPGPVGDCWWHVVGCPEHTLHMHPLADPPEVAREAAEAAAAVVGRTARERQR